MAKSLWLASALLFLTACGSGGGGGGVSASAEELETPVPETPVVEEDDTPVNIGGDGDLYDPERLIIVDITMAPDEFAILRGEGRTLASASRECLPEYEYTEFTASVTIDGDTLDDVIIRKKGFLGSLSRSRPSVKLDFNDLVDDRTYQQMSRMTLNNNRQDASNVRQCVAYDLFREAGLVAPRCNFARVTVNGEDFGVYTNVEPIKDPFLKLNFNSDEGNLYEAQISDFGEFLNDKFEKKNNKKADDRTDLQAISEALALPDDEMLAALVPLVNLDYFIKFWAMETLVGAWDSATGNANNYYIYRSPADNLFYFIPWGADTALAGTHTLKPDTGALYRNFRLASRLYAIESTRNQYFAEIDGYLDGVWSEQMLLSKIEQIRALTATEEAALEPVTRFISGNGSPADADYVPGQRERLQAAMASGEPEAPEYLVADKALDCAEPMTTNLIASVSADSGIDTGAFSFTLESGQVVNASLDLASLQVDSLEYSVTTDSAPPVIGLLLIGADADDNFTPYVLQVFIEAPEYVVGDHSLHGFVTNVLLFTVDDRESRGVSILAVGSTGTITLNSIGPEGDVDLSIDATLEFQPD